MKKDTIDNLFKNLEGTFDVENTPKEHQNRFLEKLKKDVEATKRPKTKRLFWFKAVSVAALIAIVFSLSSTFSSPKINQGNLASVSPEMEKTESFFTATIYKELQTLKNFKNKESEVLVNDALKQLDILEKNYQKLQIDLLRSGNNKRVVYAMINNFQNRINVLQQVIQKIEEINILNIQKNENIL